MWSSGEDARVRNLLSNTLCHSYGAIMSLLVMFGSDCKESWHKVQSLPMGRAGWDYKIRKVRGSETSLCPHAQ